jgi:hypothetical protein
MIDKNEKVCENRLMKPKVLSTGIKSSTTNKLIFMATLNNIKII